MNYSLYASASSGTGFKSPYYTSASSGTIHFMSNQTTIRDRIFQIKSRRLLRLFSRLNRCLAWAWLGAILGSGLGYVSHRLEEIGAREFVASVEPRLMDYKQTYGRFPESIESLGIQRPRVDLMKIDYFAGESEFTFRYPNSFSLFGGDWEYRSGSWSDS